MSLISWHKPGQKVACIAIAGAVLNPDNLPLLGPKLGDVCTIAHVVSLGWGIAFVLCEFPPTYAYAAGLFRPVYPQAIEDLRRLCAPVSTRELEPA